MFFSYCNKNYLIILNRKKLKLNQINLIIILKLYKVARNNKAAAYEYFRIILEVSIYSKVLNFYVIFY